MRPGRSTASAGPDGAASDDRRDNPHRGDGARLRRVVGVLIAGQWLLGIPSSWAADGRSPGAQATPAVMTPAVVKTPEEQFKEYPNQLAQIPATWSTTNPIRLQVCFNLKYPPNSPEANEFLQTWYRSITAKPFEVQLRMERVVFPAKFSYCGSLTFRNWQNNRAYETSDVFLKYYREQWKPNAGPFRIRPNRACDAAARIGARRAAGEPVTAPRISAASEIRPVGRRARQSRSDSRGWVAAAHWHCRRPPPRVRSLGIDAGRGGVRASPCPSAIRRRCRPTSSAAS